MTEISTHLNYGAN